MLADAWMRRRAPELWELQRRRRRRAFRAGPDLEKQVRFFRENPGYRAVHTAMLTDSNEDFVHKVGIGATRRARWFTE